MGKSNNTGAYKEKKKNFALSAFISALSVLATTSSSFSADLTSLLPEKYKKNGYVTIGSQQTVPPIEFRDPGTLKLKGASIDLINEVGTRLAVEFRYMQAEYSALIPGIEAKRFNIASGAISDTIEREAKLDFINYLSAGASILVRQDESAKFKTIDDFCGLTMATLLGSRVIMTAIETASEKCVANGKSAIKVEQLPSAPDARQQLDLKRVDGYLGDFPALAYMVQQMPGRYDIVDKNYVLVPYITSWGFPKNETGLRDAIKAAMDEMVADGTYKKILTEWGLEAAALPEITINFPASQR
ncbi:ABC transporter substrate-binding protein [Bartonella sp. HY329]|uniref:ABC transporter substrate-binding protein n=1 Tax=unclassified Bartonella TaxID=2645622 RepID=UPI0021C6AAE2|nr:MULTISPECIES: ABC transporter substrate-binding protein [unclassified Bartonella]UXM96079.1 ABC transporter substrate-binding protein [Bartonella sp. HY329]UXN10403.1 ABC transporter substrate-binding protein [Bartonella sp. HY328]